MTGSFITIEGMEGAGKSTCMSLAAAEIEKRGKPQNQGQPGDT